VIDARSVSFRYRQDWVLKDLSFVAERGKVTGIIGPNGAGKSTLLKLLYRLISPHRGEIFYEGRPLSGMTQPEIARRVAVVPQETHLLFPFRVAEIVLMGRTPYLGGRMFEGPADRAKARDAMARADVLAMAERPIDELSGGERKRVFIARALAQEPEVILLDEPTGSLDLHHQVDFLNLVIDLSRESGLTVLMATHDMNLASEFCDRLLLLDRGSLYRKGSPAEVLTRDVLSAVYGCDVGVDPNPYSGLPRITLFRKGAHRHAPVERD
jgi:iron complex transport system ATP-binding protein